MQQLNIVAASPESARSLLETLSDFQAKLVDAVDGGYEVTVTLRGGDREILEVLNALERYVTARDHSTRISLDGHEYVMHPDPAG